MTSYLLTLPYPPSLNSLYKITCKPFPKTYLSAKGKEYKLQIKEYIAKNNLQLKANIPLIVTIEITPPDKRKRDIDNLFKILFDSLTEAEFWEDDSCVREFHAAYQLPQKPGSLLMHVEPMKEEEEEEDQQGIVQMTEDQIEAHQLLSSIARLQTKTPLDWLDPNQKKYFIDYKQESKLYGIDYSTTYQISGAIYASLEACTFIVKYHETDLDKLRGAN